MITSCLECRRRKLKCDKSQPCGHCLKNGRECHYLSPKLDEASQLRLTQFKDKVGSLERQLERNAVASSQRQGGRSGPLLADEVADEAEDGSTLEMTEMVNTDVAYDDDADGGADDLVDLGVMVGKMRITERIGGMARPRISEEVSVLKQPTSHRISRCGSYCAYTTCTMSALPPPLFARHTFSCHTSSFERTPLQGALEFAK